MLTSGRMSRLWSRGKRLAEGGKKLGLFLPYRMMATRYPAMIGAYVPGSHGCSKSHHDILRIGFHYSVSRMSPYNQR